MVVFENFFGGAFFDGGFFGEGRQTTGGGDSKGRLHEKKPRRGKVIRWADFATSEERRIALAQALAVAAEPIQAMAEDHEEEFEEEDALITALVMSRVIH